MPFRQIESLSEINEQPEGTVCFCDIDDTLIDHPYMLGSKAWRSYLSKITEGYGTSGSHHDIFTLFVVENHPVVTVEPITAQWIKKLQAEGCSVYGLTARERNIWFYTPRESVDLLTCVQLAYAGIDLDKNAQSDLQQHFMKIQEYFKGIFFCNIDSKGDYLKNLLGGTFPRPKKVIFVDDKREHVEGVAEALAVLGIDYECYWYCAVDKKTQSFDPLVANLQLYYCWLSKGRCILSDEEARCIARTHPEKEAFEYLQAVQDSLMKPVVCPIQTVAIQQMQAYAPVDNTGAAPIVPAFKHRRQDSKKIPRPPKTAKTQMAL